MLAIATASLLALVNQVSGTPYISGGDTARGTDCSGLASWVANAATGRPVYGDRFNTGNEEAALRARGFVPGTAPGALNIGWNRPIIRKLDQFHTTIISQALEDPLTKVGNRRYFHKTCQSYFDVAQREKKYFIVAICDLDKFKSVNDTYGHEVGDEVLKDFANLVKKTLRPFDVVARLGGEEFAIILANTNPKSAQLIFDRLLDVIRNNTCRYTLSSGDKKGSLKYTTSSAIP